MKHLLIWTFVLFLSSCHIKADESSVENIKNETKNTIVQLTNAQRVEHGLKPLQWAEDASIAAQAKSDDMAKNQYFAHESPVYGDFVGLLEAYEVEYHLAAENLAVGQKTPEDAVIGWMNSKGHRENILHEEMTHIGVGYDEEGKYWTQILLKK